MWKTLTRLIVLIPGLVVASGCVPPIEPVWLGDSSGFIYSQSDGAVVHYDLSKDASRVLLGPGGHICSRAAISPDGKRVAMAVAGWGEKSRAVSVVVVRLADGVTEASTIEKWGDPNAPRAYTAASAFWCPSGERVLIGYGEGPLASSGRFVVYDVRTQAMRELETAPPAVLLASACGTSPLRPDGSGYLAVNMDPSGYEFFFVDWEGWEHSIEMPPEIASMLEGMLDEHRSAFQRSSAALPAKATSASDSGNRRASGNVTDFPVLPTARWEDKTLLFAIGGRTVGIDTQSRQITVQPPSDANGSLSKVAPEPGPVGSENRMRYEAASFRNKNLQIICTVVRDPKRTLRIELLDRSQERRRLLLTGYFASVSSVARVLIPSPDGKHVLVQLEDGENRLLHVVDERGQIVTKLNAGSADREGE